MIRVRDLTLSHDRHPAVHHLSGAFAPGSLTAIVGPNGAGKTTLLRALAGLHPVDHGTLDRGGLKPADIALLPQSSALDRSFPISCLDVVALGHAPRRGLFRAIGTADLARAGQALEAVGLAGFAQRPVRSLSAGQFQRVLFARLLVQDAPVMLLDEPFNAVDERTAADLMRVVRDWHGQGRTIVAVLHDHDLVRREFPECLLLAREAIAWGETATALSAANRLRARAMAEAWAARAEVCARAA
jgi:zinc/manganese transport system ATP-binding protein